MKRKNHLFYILLIFYFLVSWGCDKDRRGCPLSENYLLVLSHDADNNNITGTGAVKEVVLYVFDKNGYYLETLTGMENERIPLRYKGSTPITVIGWGNTGGGHEKMPILSPGKSRTEDAFVTLLSSGIYALSPDDLFFGGIKLDLDAHAREHLLILKRKAASMNIQVKGLQEFAGTTDTDFYFVVNGSPSSLNFSGAPAGEAAAYRSGGLITQNGYFVSGIFNTFPSSGTNITIDIYKGNTKIYTASADSSGNPLILLEGRLLNVLINLSGTTQTVSVSIREWGNVDINQDF